ncbi:KRAB [Mytilus edulis]|uniref:KRAB n=1 Tax=Mytilus edulis TaxID=6550 RepID=A0A8S3VB90_MYTED|nr:KRAB [Mytilus edulis]
MIDKSIEEKGEDIIDESIEEKERDINDESFGNIADSSSDSSENESTIDPHCEKCGKKLGNRLHTKSVSKVKKVLSKKDSQVGAEDTSNMCIACRQDLLFRNSVAEFIDPETEDKTFMCKICQKIFTTRSSIRRHVNRHAGKRKYPCQICDKVFTQNADLKRHARTHTQEKPFSCSTCGKKFRQILKSVRNISGCYIHEYIYSTLKLDVDIHSRQDKIRQGGSLFRKKKYTFEPISIEMLMYFSGLSNHCKCHIATKCHKIGLLTSSKSRTNHSQIIRTTN